MSNRRTTAERRAALRQSLRADIASGVLVPGSALPSLRELGERFDLSRSTVQVELEPLIAEGLLHARSRRGVFVASSAPIHPDRCCLFVSEPWPAGSMVWLHMQLAQRGFERRVTRLGGHATFARRTDLHDDDFRQRIPDIAGVFYYYGASPNDGPEGAGKLRQVCRVRYGYPDDAKPDDRNTADWVHFDDLDGGRQATQHLISQGHRRIAFLAAHPTPMRTPQSWSQERQSGWKAALTRAFPGADLVSFHPTDQEVAAGGGPSAVAWRTAQHVLPHLDDFDAIVGADDVHILALVDALRAASVPAATWPAMVGFEGLPETENYVLTSIVPPWEQIGETAAEIIWSRLSGRLSGAVVERVVTMNLVSRLSSHKDWNSQGSADILLSRR